MSVKLGKEKIEQLLRKAVEKYIRETGEAFHATQTPSNFNGLATKLTEKAQELPACDPKAFPPETLGKGIDLSGRYRITNAQVRDAYFGKVDNLKEYFYEACHLYLYEKLSKDCEKEPAALPPAEAEEQEIKEPQQPPAGFGKPHRFLVIALALALAALLFFVFKWYTLKKQVDTIKKDMNILPYQPTEAEIASLEGVWEVYTGSPQARKFGPHGYHMTVGNIMEIKYKNGYFTFNRYGPSFNQLGYLQFEAPDYVSIHSYYNNDTDVVVSPKHSLMKLEAGKRYLTAISASWTFDPKENSIIGIREVFRKLGKGGSLKIIQNKLENALCPECKIIHWHRENNRVDTLRPKNELLDSLPPAIHQLIDENSILLKDPDSTRLPVKKE